MAQRQRRKRAKAAAPVSGKAPAGAAVAFVGEQQEHGDSLIRLSEYAVSRALTGAQQEVFTSQVEKLAHLGLKLEAELDYGLRLRASQVVGSARFVHGRKEVVVQVEPKVGSANFLRMLDHTTGAAKVEQRQTKVGTERATPVGLFLEYFAGQMFAFLNRHNYRDYSFAVMTAPGKVKGRPLIHDYITKSLPRAQPFILPCRYLDYSADVLENQILALAIHVASQTASLLNDASRRPLIRLLMACSRLLPGVSVRRVTVSEIRSIRYNRTNERFIPIHRLCEMIIGSHSISLKPSERIPFLSFAIDMAKLFEEYVSACFKAAFAVEFVGDKYRLRFPIGAYDKTIVLDGFLTRRGRRMVVECKYKNIGRLSEDAAPVEDADDFEIAGGRIRGSDLYQSVAYASHQKVQADASILVYPAWTEGAPAVEVARPIESFGWLHKSMRGVPVYILGINLSSDFRDAVRDLQGTADRLLDEMGAPRQTAIHAAA